MRVFQVALLVLLLAGLLAFGVYAISGDRRYRTLGTRLVLAALFATAVFFGVLIVERIPQLF